MLVGSCFHDGLDGRVGLCRGFNTHQKIFPSYSRALERRDCGDGGCSWFANRTPPLEAQVCCRRVGVGQSPARCPGRHPASALAPAGAAVRVSLPEGVRGVLAAWLPLVLGAGVAQVSGFVDTLLGSFTGPGGVSALGYAQLIQVLPVSLFGVSVAAVSLPELSRDATAAFPNELLRTRIATAFRRITFFVLPSAFAFAALGPVIVGALFQTGRFGADDTALVGGVLAAYGVGLVGQATVKLFASGFYALRDTRTPVKIATLSLLVSTGLAVLLMRRYGPAGIAFGLSLEATISVVLHLRDLDRRIGAILTRADWRAAAVSLAAAGVAVAASVAATQATTGLSPVPLALVGLGIFAVTYLAFTMALKHPDAARLWKLVS
jgi:putative peptidoglycan lipid II flippase